MKRKATMKQVKVMEENIIRVGYCGLYYLLRDIEPAYYTSGVYGWNADIYDLGNCMIVTGYRPFGNILVSYELGELYNDTAKAIWENPALTYEEQKTMVEELRYEFIEKTLRRYAEC